jgi:hypothetical protein
MKKSIIALAVAGAMTAPMVAQADATLFGEIRYDITKEKDTKANSDITRMRFGVKGEETMDNGLTAGYFIRLDATGSADNANVSTEKTTVYVAGDFGKVVMGDTSNPNESVEDRTEYGLYSGSLVVVDKGFNGGGLAYESNDMNGLKFAVGVGSVNSESENSYGAMVSYDTDTFGVTVGAGKTADTAATAQSFAFNTTTGATDTTAAAAAEDGESNYGISASMNVAGATLGARYSVQKTTDEKTKGYAIGGKYTIDKLTLALQHEQVKTTGDDERQAMTALDATYALGGNATVTLAAINYNDDAEDATATNKDAVKLRYKITF